MSIDWGSVAAAAGVGAVTGLNQFKAETGSIICRELLGLDGKDNSPVPSKRTEEYYKKRTCEDKVGLAAKILDEYIQSHCPNGTCNF